MPRGAKTSKWSSLPEHLKKSGPSGLQDIQAKLAVRRPGVPEVELVIDQETFSIGRQTDEVDLVLDDDLVSKRHAKLSVDDRGYVSLTDEGSTNGIQYQGRTVRRLNLVDGDEFEIGKTSFMFRANLSRYEPASEPNESPEKETSMVLDADQIPEPEVADENPAQQQAQASPENSGDVSPESPRPPVDGPAPTAPKK